MVNFKLDSVFIKEDHIISVRALREKSPQVDLQETTDS